MMWAAELSPVDLPLRLNDAAMLTDRSQLHSTGPTEEEERPSPNQSPLAQQSSPNNQK